MCMYSVTAANSRDARQGEDLVVTQATHGQSNWLTEGGKPNVAVCVPCTAVLAVQLPEQSVRGAIFEQAKSPDKDGNRDFLNFLDDAKERVPLNHLPKQTKIRVLHLRAANLDGAEPSIPAAIGEPQVEPARQEEMQLVTVNVRTGRDRQNRIPRFFPDGD